MLFSLYKRYVRAADHPSKLRIIRLWERFLFNGKTRKVSTRQGHTIVFNKPDSIEHTVLTDGCYEPATLDFISNNLSPGDTFVGAGSAYGFHLMAAADAVGENGTVVGIEPQPESLYRTYQNICASGLRGRIRLVSTAIAPDGTFIPITVPGGENRGSSSISARQDTHPEDYVVHGATLQTIFAALQIQSPPRLFVLDVEGFESAVLATLSTAWQPEVIVFEIAPWFIDHGYVDPEKLRQQVESLGYKISDMFGTSVSDLSSVAEHNAVAWLPDRKEPNWLPSSNHP